MSELAFEQVYWREDVGYAPLRACSGATRGLYYEVRALCWYAVPRGHLLLDGAPIALATLSGLVNMPAALVQAGLVELVAHGVLDFDAGVYADRRMVAREARRIAKAAAATVSVVVVDSAEERRAKDRARSARRRKAKKAERVLAQMRDFAAMETAAVLSGRVTQNVTLAPIENIEEASGRHARVHRTIVVEDQTLRARKGPAPPRVYNQKDSTPPQEPEPGPARPPHESGAPVSLRERVAYRLARRVA